MTYNDLSPRAKRLAFAARWCVTSEEFAPSAPEETGPEDDAVIYHNSAGVVGISAEGAVTVVSRIAPFWGVKVPAEAPEPFARIAIRTAFGLA